MTSASMPCATTVEKEELEEKLQVAQSLHFPIGELEEARAVLAKLNNRAQVVNSLDQFL